MSAHTLRHPSAWLLWCGFLGTSALAGLSAPAGAQAVGSEFQINTYTTGDQTTGSLGGRKLVAADASGNFVVVWTDGNFHDGSGTGVFGQRYDSGGAALGDEFQVNSFTSGSQRSASVAAAADGAFVVVWQSEEQDGSFYGIFGQRYDSAGMAQGAEFRVNSTTRGGEFLPSVASDAAGNFVVVWTGQDESGNGTFGQRYDREGVPRGGEFRVNSYTTGSQNLTSVASDASGNFVVVWGSYRQDGSEYGIFGQRYDSAGVVLGGEFRVNSYTTRRQWFPTVASDASGNFVVAWVSNLQDGSLYGIFGQRFDSAGGARGGEFQVNSYTPSGQSMPAVASDASGNLVVVWESFAQDRGNSLGVFGQRYDSGGVAQGDEFQVNSFATGHQYWASVASTGTNQFVVAWVSNLGQDTVHPQQDGSGSGVFGQRFDFGGGTIQVESPNTGVTWRIGSLKRIKWTHNLGVAATFNVELDRDDDGNYEELIAAHAGVDSATRGHFAWTVTGPPSAAARVRVSWTDDPGVSDSSDTTFRIKPLE